MVHPPRFRHHQVVPNSILNSLHIMNAENIKQAVIEKLSDIGYRTDDCVEKAIINAQQNEESDIARDVLFALCENIEIAKEKNFPLCQDTGLVVFWVKLYQGYKKNDEINLTNILNQAVREAFKLNNFRQSVVDDPINRVNTGDNTPAIIHFEYIDSPPPPSLPECSLNTQSELRTPNSELRTPNYLLSPNPYPLSPIIDISIMLKGGGAENMSALKMMKPADGIQGIRDFVLDVVRNAGGNACPPLTVGIGIGGNFETCALLAKKSLFRRHDEVNKDNFWANEEKYLLKEINKLGIGPLGLGGNTTALKVNIEVAPCHIASLPVAVNLECHAHRVVELRIED